MSEDIFDRFKNNLLAIDPIYFIEKYLTLEGKPFRLTNNGYRPFADIYRYIAIKALERTSKPIVIIKGRQVGATTMCSALEMYFMGCGLFGNGSKPPIRIIHAFPQLDIAYAYSKTKLNPMVSGSIATETAKKGQKPKSYMQSLLDPTSPTNDSLNFKQFVGGNHIWIESTGDTGDRLRGRSADIIFWDEAQDYRGQAIGTVSKLLTQSNYGKLGEGVQVFFGTPKQRGSEFYDMWNKSSQQYYHLHCESCDNYFPLYTPGTDDWEKTWISEYTVECPHCQHQQNKVTAAEKGKWVATKNPDECDYIGFHMSQLFIPNFSKEKIIGEKPENSVTNSERVYQNEVLGEFFSGETGIITPDQIRDLCGDVGRKFRAHISPSESPGVFVGIDIGQKADLEQMIDTKKSKTQGQSFSVAVVLNLVGPNLLQIEYVRKFKQNDYASKKEFIEHLMRMYSANVTVCDIGYANDFCQIMHTEHGERFIASNALPQVNGNMRYVKDVFPKVIQFSKDHCIGELYEQMKKGHIRFPMGDYEKLSWFIGHCTSMEIKPTISRSGDVTPHYVKGSQPNDGFMALLNAYLGYKWYQTKGFTINNPMLFHDPFSKEKPRNNIPALLGVMPRMR